MHRNNRRSVSLTPRTPFDGDLDQELMRMVTQGARRTPIRDSDGDRYMEDDVGEQELHF